jgi:hypothetical protein
MKMLIIVDPNMVGPSEAILYQDKGGYRLHRLRALNFAGDAYETAHWCARLKSQYPEATLKIEGNGPGAVIIEMLEKMVPA